MSNPDLASIFNLKFYRKQKKWRFVREVLSDHVTEPECSPSTRSLLNQTYDVQVSVELPAPVALDDAFIDSANAADRSSGGDFDPPPPYAPQCPPSPPQSPPQSPLDRTFSELDLDLKESCRYPDDVTDSPDYHARVDQLYGYTTDICDRDKAMCAHAVDNYIECVEPRDMERDIWRDRDLPGKCAKGWPKQSLIWTNAGDELAPEHWMRMYNEAAPELPSLDFVEEERLLTEACDWLRYEGGCGGADEVEGVDGGDGTTNLLLHKLSPRCDRLLAWGGPPSPPLASPPSSPSLDTLDTLDSASFIRGAHQAPHSSVIELGDETPVDGDSSWCRLQMSRHARALHALLRHVRRDAATRDCASATAASGEQIAHRHSYLSNPSSYDDFPTHDVGPSLPPPLPPLCRPSPNPSLHHTEATFRLSPPFCHPNQLYRPAAQDCHPTPQFCRPELPLLGRGRGRMGGQGAVVGLSAGRPYRL